MNRVVFYLFVCAAILLSGLLGLFGAYGACLPIWGSRVFDTALGSPPDRAHPAFWFSLALLAPSMLLSTCGAVALLILPMAFRFPAAARLSARYSYQLRFLRWYAEQILRYVSSHDRGPTDDNRTA